MRAAAILGLGNFSKYLAKFQKAAGVEWSSEVSQESEAVMIFGGDGTVHHQLEKLAGRDIPTLIVPCGSGNDFARALKLNSVHDSLKAWGKYVAGAGNIRVIDLGTIREQSAGGPAMSEAGSATVPHEHYFCCVAGVGIDAAIAQRSSTLPKWLRAHGGYALSAPREFIRFAAFPMKVTGAGQVDSFKPTILAAVANAPAFGGGMKIAPHAKLDDGKFDICVVRAMNTLKLFCLFPTVYFGRHLGFEQIEYAQAATARIETERPMDVYADGEYVCKTPVEFRIARNALTVIVPD